MLKFRYYVLLTAAVLVVISCGLIFETEPPEENDGGQDAGSDISSDLASDKVQDTNIINDGSMDIIDINDVSDNNNEDVEDTEDTDEVDTTVIECTDSIQCNDKTKSKCDNNLCVPCDDNIYCAHISGLNFCDNGQCFECIEEVDCVQKTDTPHCLDNVCVNCRDDNDCPDGRCKLDTHQCVQCLEEIDCADLTDTQHCLDNVCVNCRDDNDCSRSYCESSQHQCVECYQNEHCTFANISRCDLNTYECTGCENNDDCIHIDNKHVCNTDDNNCVECTTNSDCELNLNKKVCGQDGGFYANQCVECVTHSDCIYNPLFKACNYPFNVCVECYYSDDFCECSDLNCTGMGVCIDKASQHYCHQECRECYTDSDCSDLNYYCVIDDNFGGKHCRKEASNDTCPTPWRLAIDVRSNGGNTNGQLVDVCLPPSTTTCLGLSELGIPCQSNESTLCGENDISNDARCGSEGYCTYNCTDNNQCPDGYACGTISPRHCIK